MSEKKTSRSSSQSETEYFYQVNQELIDRKRQELDAVRKGQEKAARKEQHWMKCPKCGGQMTEIDLSGIMVDKCNDCLGIYFDHGELDLLLSAQERSGFWGGLKKRLK